MAYVDFGADPLHIPYAGTPRVEIAAPQDERLSALEWSVVALARYDRPSSLAQPGRLAIALGKVFGTRPNGLHLADPRLEALRRMAVLYWTHGAQVAAEERDTFLGAGFSAAQYRTMTASIDAARVGAGVRA